MNLFNEPEPSKITPSPKVRRLGTEQVQIVYGAGEFHAKALDVRGWEAVGWSSHCPWDAAARCVWHLFNRRVAFGEKVNA